LTSGTTAEFVIGAAGRVKPSGMGIIYGVAIGATIIIGAIPICIGCCESTLAWVTAGTKHTKVEHVGPHAGTVFAIVSAEKKV